MTAPAPGFPPELETAITEALAEHSEWRNWAGPNTPLHAACECGETIAEAGAFEPAAFAAHQAAVVMEVIARHTTTEWGVRWHGCGSDVDETGSEFVSREFAAQGADYGFSDTTVARLVLPWQEVKA
ncbi:hypothetical protein C6401_15340 [Arthrobacter woluwensis]|uniref:hypothetical protein n=1 Tax=Arthrobacter woluwensis TaxID=156980 RepID=UPI000D13D67C|nr:hypothetical protein [Arthrobacter woluwensis]PSS42929.1 hypothetical protein C6401_15340 [Arthrobacter woluwensis]